MVNKNYIKGKKFERRVAKSLESLGYVVVMAGGRKFPDGIALRSFSILFPKYFVYECKVNKYLSKEEKESAKEIKLKTGLPFLVFWREKKTWKIRHYEIESDINEDNR